MNIKKFLRLTLSNSYLCIMLIALLTSMIFSGFLYASPDYNEYLPYIPSPTFGMTESHWMYTNQTYDFGSGLVAYSNAGNGPYTHYIDTTHPSSTDSANSFGTPDKPRKTWPIQVPPGSVVELHGGPYSFGNWDGNKMAFTSTGTVTRPIFFRGVSTNDMPAITRSLNLLGSYLLVENIAFTNDAGIIIRSDLTYLTTITNNLRHHHLAVRDCLFRGTRNIAQTGSGISGIGGWEITSLPAGVSVSDVTILRNSMADYGDWTNAAENDTLGVCVDGFSVSNIWIIGNEIWHMGGDGIRVGSNPGSIRTDGYNTYVVGNYIHDNRENSLDIKQTDDIVVIGNKFSGARPCSSDPGGLVPVHYDPHRIWFLFNTLSDADKGITCTGAYDLYVIGNQFSNINHTDTTNYVFSGYKNGAAIQTYSSDRIYIINNTMVDYDVGIQIPQGLQIYVYNNAFAWRAETSGYDIYYPPSDGTGDMDYNLFYNGVGIATRIAWKGFEGTAAYLSSTYNIGIHQKEGQDPHFKEGMFDILPNSPLINTGCEVSYYDIYQSSYGYSIKMDIDGNIRPQGFAWDIGAYEYFFALTNSTTSRSKSLMIRWK